MHPDKGLLQPWELLHNLHRGSSDVDWCEGNYVVSSFIAEFVNTLSNILFLVVPPLLIFLFQNYAKSVQKKDIFIIWVLLIAVGLSSAYFHATLSFAGQMLDELAILWLICAGFAIWMPSRFLPVGLHRRAFKMGMLAITITGTILACIRPVVNAFALMTFGIPITVMLVVEMRRCKNDKIYRLGIRTVILFGSAVFCWLNDRLMCEVWLKVCFP
ncbi:hypothetical protein RvY_14686-2 [Ramazzottius varieornatus]|uniref:Alkaline ceramidase n=1 Tax=Ramazzottius varieornatus TaxID=947166 RepID=A0A1D1VZE4_RAMVA|nr:hypothetical protein RvY_14686-2 [Ramazzottius varieornatus]